MTEGYDEVPTPLRTHLDEFYTRRGVVIWWNSKNDLFAGASAREMWKTEAGRARVWQVVEMLETSAYA